ncbi:hypothetical protein B0F90DRAFT_1774555, partial [Multifurca ochricompacta]
MPARRRSTTILMMEEEFGIHGPPQTVTRIGIPAKFRILPSMRRQSSTQAPEPHRNPSFLRGSWETVWDYDVEKGQLMDTPPNEDEDEDALFEDPLDCEEQEIELNQDVDTPWATGHGVWTGKRHHCFLPIFRVSLILMIWSVKVTALDSSRSSIPSVLQSLTNS